MEKEKKDISYIEEVKGSHFWYRVGGGIDVSLYFDIREVQAIHIEPEVDEDKNYCTWYLVIALKSGSNKRIILDSAPQDIDDDDSFSREMQKGVYDNLLETNNYLEEVLGKISERKTE